MDQLNVEQLEGIEVNDVLQAPEIQEESAPSLEDVLSAQDQTEQAEKTAEPTGKEKKSEPGWIRGRIDDAVRKATAQVRAEMEAEYETKLAPFHEMMIAQEADKLVADGKIADRDLAIQFVRLQKGMPVPEKSEPPRNDKGQFAPKETTSPDPEIERHGEILFAQAKAIKAAGGPDVMAIYESNPEVKQRILSREWDFSDVAQAMAGRQIMPSPARSANALGVSRKQISDLTDAEFDALNDKLSSGLRVDLTK